MSAGAGPSTIHVPPLPDKLRAEPRQEEIGPGRPYANAAAFSADHARWEQERDARRKLMAERLKAQKKVHEQSRDRTARQRPPDDGDRREKQRQQQHSSARSQSFKTPTIQLFFQLANLTWLVLNSSASGVRERLLSAWEKVLGRRPPPSATIQYSVREPRQRSAARFRSICSRFSGRMRNVLSSYRRWEPRRPISIGISSTRYLYEASLAEERECISKKTTGRTKSA